MKRSRSQKSAPARQDAPSTSLEEMQLGAFPMHGDPNPSSVVVINNVVATANFGVEASRRGVRRCHLRIVPC